MHDIACFNMFTANSMVGGSICGMSPPPTSSVQGMICVDQPIACIQASRSPRVAMC